MTYKKGQVEAGIVLFAALGIGLIIIAPLMMKVFLSFQQPLSDALGNVSSANGGPVAQANFNAIMDPLVTWWDKAVVAAYVASILILFVSSFLVDTHPFFIVFYILVCFLLILFSPFIMHAADVIYTSANFATEVTHLTWMDYIRNHYFELLLGIIFLNGIIMYGKVAFFQNQVVSR